MNEPTLHLFYLDRLTSELEARKKINPAYSMRSFARYLGIDSSSLSSILAGKRKIPERSIEQFADKLQLQGIDKQKFIVSAYKKAYRNLKKFGDQHISVTLSPNQQALIMSDWRYMAVLNLLKTKYKDCTAEGLARKLGESKEEMGEILQQLVNSKMIYCDSGVYCRVSPHFKTTDQILDDVVRNSALKNLALAKQKLESISLELQEFTTIVLPLNMKKLPLAKELIRNFHLEMKHLMQDEECTEVYQLSLQFFPLSMLSEEF